MDYGTVTEVEIENVKFLPTFFAELPVQALRGCLSHIKPLEYHWSHKATKHFLGLVAELMLYAEITEIDQEVKRIFRPEQKCSFYILWFIIFALTERCVVHDSVQHKQR